MQDCPDSQVSHRASGELLNYVQGYFMEKSAPCIYATSSIRIAGPMPRSSTVHQTTLPPMYLQRHAHSVTVVGFAVHKLKLGETKPTRSIIALDPGLRPSPGVIKLHSNGLATRKTSERLSSSEAEVELGPYLRQEWKLQKYKAFELVRLLRPQVLSTAGETGGNSAW